MMSAPLRGFRGVTISGRKPGLTPDYQAGGHAGPGARVLADSIEQPGKAMVMGLLLDTATGLAHLQKVTDAGRRHRAI